MQKVLAAGCCWSARAAAAADVLKRERKGPEKML
jgi:hypothetical protein